MNAADPDSLESCDSSISCSSRGYDRNLFVEEPPVSLRCPVCKLTLRDPHLLSCCGAHICEVCIDPIKSSNGPCPYCLDEDYATLLNKQLKRRVAELRAVCSNNGCPWSGELLYLADHLKKCDYTLKQCSHGCGEYSTKLQLSEHEKHHCPKRPMSLQIESMKLIFTETLKQMEEKYEKETKRLDKKLVEQEKMHRKEIDVLQKQISQLQILIDELPTTDQTPPTSTNAALLISAHAFPLPDWCYPLPVSAHVVPPCLFIMPKFNKHKTKNDHWFSQPFYSHQHGYKLCLRVNANGDGEGKGSYVSLFVYIMRGEYDDQLNWPFYGELTLQLLNWIEDKGHIEKTLPLDESVPEQYNGRQVKYSRGKGWGYQRFIAIEKLARNVMANTQFLYEDKLCFRVLKAIVKKQ